MVKCTDEIFETICARISAGESLREICDEKTMPTRKTFFAAMNERPDRVNSYARAREAQGDDQFERVCQIADKVERGELDPASARVAIDARKWIAGKLRPKVYGDKIDLSSSDGTMSPPKEIRLNIIAPVRKDD